MTAEEVLKENFSNITQRQCSKSLKGKDFPCKNCVLGEFGYCGFSDQERAYEAWKANGYELYKEEK